MGRISRQIGWSENANILWYILQKLQRLTSVIAVGSTTTTTTTSTSTSTTTSTTSTTTTAP